MKVEIVSNVVFFHFDEELVALEVTEPLDPSGAGLTIVIVVNVL